MLYILIAVAVVLLVFVIVVASRPSDFRTTRSATIAASSTIVFEQINDLHKWQAWSPWAKLDPNAKNTFTGPPAGTGAAFTWSGNSKVGEGTMTITESRPNEFVQFRLDFRKPFKGTNTAEFTLTPEGEKTNVSWSNFGKANFVMKAVGLVLNCDKMMGDQFEKGLADLKQISEAANKG